MKWTEEETNFILYKIKEGKTYKELSILLGRSENSIRTRLFHFGEKWTKNVKLKKDYNCLHCGSIFTDTRVSNRKFCSHSCSTIYSNLIRGIKSKEIKECLNCLKETKSKYCSNKCQRDYEKQTIFKKIENGDTTLNEKQYKKYLVNKFGNKCMKCGWNEVNETTGNVPIQLEHIDGNYKNNNLSNLKLLCPNCHSLTPTYGSLNIGKGRKRYKK